MAFRDLRSLLVKPALPGLAVLGLLVAACNQVGTATFTFWDLVWSMVIFFFWFMLIWIFISIFADIFRRNDLTGGWKTTLDHRDLPDPVHRGLIYITAGSSPPGGEADYRAGSATKALPASPPPTRSRSSISSRRPARSPSRSTRHSSRRPWRADARPMP